LPRLNHLVRLLRPPASNCSVSFIDCSACISTAAYCCLLWKASIRIYFRIMIRVRLCVYTTWLVQLRSPSCPSSISTVIIPSKSKSLKSPDTGHFGTGMFWRPASIDLSYKRRWTWVQAHKKCVSNYPFLLKNLFVFRKNY
jgi:hypothetical protein